jgi:KaiC/GvpD/RAD55 family RecA-like ATPase
MNLMELPKLIVETFKGREDVIAYQNGEAFAPHQCPEGIDPQWIADHHLAGTQCYGFYIMRPDNTVWCSCIDFDNKPNHPDPQWRDKAEMVYWELVNAGITPRIEISQSNNGAHVWTFFSEPIDAALVRAWWLRLGEKIEITFREINPKQNALTGKGIGNLIRYPFWNESRFVNPEDDWAALDPVEAIRGVDRLDASDLRLKAWQMQLGDLTTPATTVVTPGDIKVAGAEGLSPRVTALLARPWSLLARRWMGDTRGMVDGSPSAVALSIATELVRLYVPTAEVEAAIRQWLRMNDRGDKADRPQWIAGTLGKAYAFVTDRVEQKTADTGATTMEDCVGSYLDLLQTGSAPCFASGIELLDRSIDGVSPGEVAVIAARPSHGKSAMAFQWMDEAARYGVRGLVISEEMSGSEIGKRRLQAISTVEFDRWSKSDVPVMRDEVRRYYVDRQPVYVVENCATIDRVEEMIDQYCGIYEVGFVAVDYLQLLGGRGDRYEVVTDASRRIKQAARRNNAAVLLLSQMNRASESRNEWKPKNSDLRESGQIEQDADLILFLHWPARDDPKKYHDQPNRYIIQATKRRNGPIRCATEHLPPGMVVTEFDPMRQTFGKIKRTKATPPPPRNKR